MKQSSASLKYFAIFIALIFMGAMLVNAYQQNTQQEAEHTRLVRHIVVSAYELQLKTHELQYFYSSYVLGHPQVTLEKLDEISQVVSSKYGVLLIGENYQMLSKLEDNVADRFAESYEHYKELLPAIQTATRNDPRLTEIDQRIKEDLLDDIRGIVKSTRIGTLWKSEIAKAATKDSLQRLRLATIGTSIVFLSLISLILVQFRTIRNALVKAEQAKVSKAKFLAVAGHDLRQPLQASSLLLSTLQSRSESPENSRLFNGIHNSLESITELLNGMLDISRLDADLLTVNKEAVALTPLVRKMLDRFGEQARNKNLKLILINPTDCYIKTDELLLERIISNLLSNAIRYTQEGEVLLKVCSRDDRVLITVKDSGPGISREDQQVIFEEFIQLDTTTSDHKRGLGLGLSIVKRLCELLGHELTLSSEPGVGSQFEVSVPRATAPLQDLPHKSREQWSLCGVTVIVIEDDKDIMSSFELLLVTWGCEMLSAATMEQAQAIAEELRDRKGADSKDLLIISDYYLSQSYNGCDVIKTVKGIIGADIPAMVITGATQPEELEEIRLTGNSVFRKPIKPATLRVAIHRLLRQS